MARCLDKSLKCDIVTIGMGWTDLQHNVIVSTISSFLSILQEYSTLLKSQITISHMYACTHKILPSSHHLISNNKKYINSFLISSPTHIMPFLCLFSGLSIKNAIKIITFSKPSHFLDPFSLTIQPAF